MADEWRTNGKLVSPYQNIVKLKVCMESCDKERCSRIVLKKLSQRFVFAIAAWKLAEIRSSRHYSRAISCAGRVNAGDIPEPKEGAGSEIL
jgi:hypothetical protein